jgi:hypothetical protein
MSKNLKKSLKKAKESEKKLIKFYKKNYITYTKKLNSLYNQHVANLENIDNEIPSLNSMKTIFTEKVPTNLKKKIIKEDDITFINDYFSPKKITLSKYDINRYITDINFIKHHIQIQINLLVNQYFKKYSKNIVEMKIKIEGTDTSNNNNNNNINITNFNKVEKKKKTKKKPILSILQQKNINIILIVTLIDERIHNLKIEHKGLKINRKDIFGKLSNIIKTLHSKEKNRDSLETYMKKMNSKLQSKLLEEKEQNLKDLLIESNKTKSLRDRISTLQMEVAKSQMVTPQNETLNMNSIKSVYNKTEVPVIKEAPIIDGNFDETQIKDDIFEKKIESQLNGSNDSSLLNNSSPFKQVETEEDNELRNLLQDTQSLNNNNNGVKLSKKGRR